MMTDKTLANSDPPQQIKLPDGRSLAFSAYGDPGGNPILFFHGWPGARLQGRLTDQPAKRLGLRVIAPDRPGFGLSDFQRNRQILDWPDDIEFVAHVLGIDKFGVIGLSGGAPYALACAYKFPHRLSSVGIISGVGPSDVPGANDGVSDDNRRLIRIAGLVPWVLTLMLKRVVRQRRINPAKAFESLLASLPQPDREALSDPIVRESVMEASADTFQAGVKGHTWEMRLFGNPWGFKMDDIQAPVFLWHGDADENILPLTGEMQAEAIPNCTAKFLPNEGHYSLYLNHVYEILQKLKP